MATAIQQLPEYEAFSDNPVRHYVAAIRAGIVDGTPMPDLCYEEDWRAEVEMNVAMTSDGECVELQAKAEGHTYTWEQLDAQLNLAQSGIESLIVAWRTLVEFSRNA